MLSFSGLSSGSTGNCYSKNCYDFRSSNECNSAPNKLGCTWTTDYCQNEYNPLRESTENSCKNYENQKENCLNNELCQWEANFNPRAEAPFILWFIWIVVNIFFIGFILFILAYGKNVGSEAIVNLGIGFFILDIITRYIGFILRFRGYNSLAVLFITGGVLIIGGGWLISKWRKKLIMETEKNE